MPGGPAGDNDDAQPVNISPIVRTMFGATSASNDKKVQEFGVPLNDEGQAG